MKVKLFDESHELDLEKRINKFFNEKEVDAMTFISAFQAINDNSFIPFAIDPFGNFYCFSLKNHTIVYYEHEEKNVTETEYSVEQFVESLY